VTDDLMGFLEDLTNLRSLGLGATRITGAGMVHVRKLENLEEIRLTDSSRFTDAGLAHFTGLRKLRNLSVQYTEVTDEGLKHLYNLPNLRTVHMLGSKVTPEGRVKLSRALGVGRVLF
jgi:hypothetical protein